MADLQLAVPASLDIDDIDSSPLGRAAPDRLLTEILVRNSPDEWDWEDDDEDDWDVDEDDDDQGWDVDEDDEPQGDDARVAQPGS